MKKLVMIAALALVATNACADGWKLPQKSIWNGSNTAQHLLNDELRYVLNNNINLNNILGAVIGTVIDPRGYHGSAYPNGKRPKLNYKLGNMGTGKCFSDPKGNGIWCP
jgi:hypothetical protein|tara:strand:- start:3061 stop:3387 length:327 start_codon:yes stop_codon:yes gene_type:complete